MTASTAPDTAAKSDTSQPSAIACGPISAAIRSTSATDRASSATRAPSAAKARTAAAPIPRLAPVMTTTFPCTDIASSFTIPSPS